MIKNTYIERYRRILSDLAKTLREKYAKMGYNKDMFSTNVAEQYNAEIEAEVTKAVNKAKKSAHKVMMDVSLSLAQWACVSGKCITKDADLLTGDAYPISADELNKLIDIYSGNYTMLSLLQKYADKHSMDVYITPVEKKLEVYEKLYSGCLSMIDQIARNHGAYDEQWANNPFCLQLYDVIGTGAELQDFRVLRLEVQTPLKDYPNPAEEANYGFSFKPVQRNEQSVNLGI